MITDENLLRGLSWFMTPKAARATPSHHSPSRQEQLVDLKILDLLRQGESLISLPLDVTRFRRIQNVSATFLGAQIRPTGKFRSHFPTLVRSKSGVENCVERSAQE
jgi:hypothetical protein